MIKPFDEWNISKKETDKSNRQVIFYEREIWWCVLGINIGVEIDGKHELFLRPVVILRKFNKDSALIIPTGGKSKTGKYYLDVFTKEGKVFNARLSQIRYLSSKRLIRKMGTINKVSYDSLVSCTVGIIKG